MCPFQYIQSVLLHHQVIFPVLANFPVLFLFLSLVFGLHSVTNSTDNVVQYLNAYDNLQQINLD